MFLIEKGTDITLDKISQIIQSFNFNQRVKLQTYYDYYSGKQDILNKRKVSESKPCNRVVTNYCLNIVNNYLGYLVGKDITYTSNNNFENIQDTLNYNDVQQVDSELLRNALIFGVAYEICYIDEDNQQRFKVLDSRQCIPIYENTLNQDLMAVIRYFPIDSLDATKGYYVEVYTSANTLVYKTNSMFGSFALIEERPNYYGMVPVTVFGLNTEEKSIFDAIMGLQDAYNKLLSSEIDDWESFCDAYLCIKGIQIDEEAVEQMRHNRVLSLGELNPDAEAFYLTKNVSDTQIENILANINDTIHKIANSPDFSQESFGTSSGIALRYRLLGFENTAGSIEKSMTKALQRRLELLTAIMTLTGENATWRDVQITFTRNLPADTNEIVAIVNSLRGLVSDKTLLSQIPFVSDVEAELEALEEQRTANMELYSFAPAEEKEEDEA